MIKRKILIITLICSFISCSNFEDINRLSYYKKFEMTNKLPLRLDGLYYQDYLYRYDSSTHVIIFYSNGTFYDALTSIDYFNIVHNTDSCGSIKDLHNNYCIWCWGAYIIDRNYIKVQSFSPYMFYGIPQKRCIDEWIGIIENDTTIVFKKIITYLSSASGKILDEDNIERIFHFKQCSTKPDSTNFLMDDLKEK